MITIIRIDVEVEVILLKIKFTAMLLHEHINTILKKMSCFRISKSI